MTFSLFTTAFQDGGPIPQRYTCDGEDVSPPLAWDEPPSATQAFVLIVDDPDAPGGAFTHWVVYDISGESRELAEAVPVGNALANGAPQGKNGFGTAGYRGPCPPSGPAHHYRFLIYALDEPLNLAAGASKAQVLDAIDGHTLGHGELTGTYAR